MSETYYVDEEENAKIPGELSEEQLVKLREILDVGQLGAIKELLDQGPVSFDAGSGEPNGSLEE